LTAYANAIAERLVGTLRRECLDRVVVLNGAHLHAVLTEFVDYYNRQRPHRGLRAPLERAEDFAAALLEILADPASTRGRDTPRLGGAARMPEQQPTGADRCAGGGGALCAAAPLRWTPW
jgi:hypothetical protein